MSVADIDPERARDAAAEVADDEHPATGFAVDVRDAEQLARLVDDTVTALGGIDAVITVVGGQVAFVPSVRLHEMQDDDWDRMYELNLRYVARLVRLVLPHYLAQRHGVFVSIGSVTGFMGAPEQGAYGVMKAGLVSLARTVGAEYAADGIRMNVVAGGAIATAVANSDEEGWVDEIPMGRAGSADEIAAAVAYLCSPESRYMTGQQIVLDGGVSSRGPFR
ncbi:3-oxoacyl-[acyl-carrier protein] reductase [Microbacterium resistens]|uniref:3-oxoacyl-[acyl-carrier protein] reductase n=1 Tax=Microbacterium resistens TaxID=156977 RepID=A0ABU1SFV3_9MICO|nr:3-oxoacyl-[acyl-carrier protein] reductase [Microbacterium resistens]